jgi:uncharacterized membrane protein
MKHLATPRLAIGPGLWFGLGLGGFFDGIALHQILQWHHMLSSWYPPTTLENLRLNTLWDGIFHSATYVFVVLGLRSLWRGARAGRMALWDRALVGAMLVGWGVFNLLEGIVDHAVLGIHHVNERVAHDQWIWWDAGFLAWGLLMFLTGWAMVRSVPKSAAAGA